MVGKKAVILLSGGIDSATAAVIAKQQGFELHALSYHYGQRHERELESAKQVAAFLQANSHQVMRFDLRAIYNFSFLRGRLSRADRGSGYFFWRKSTRLQRLSGLP